MKINAVIFFLKHHPSVSQKKSTGFILPKKFLITSLVDSHKLSGITLLLQTNGMYLRQKIMAILVYALTKQKFIFLTELWVGFIKKDLYIPRRQSRIVLPIKIQRKS
jgi:hypothetical protein